jgi:hypothetical protein
MIYFDFWQTSACFDPYRAFNTVPDGFEIKESSIPGIGHGVFANVYVEQDTIIGPYKGVFDPDTESAEQSGYSWKVWNIYPLNINMIIVI